MNTNTVEKAAKALSESRLKNRKIGSLNEEIRPVAEKDAYEVQNKLHEIIEKSTGDKVVGHKIGCTTPVMQKFLSIDKLVLSNSLKKDKAPWLFLEKK